MPTLCKTGGRRIAVFRALLLGDLLCSGPAWRALRTACPDAHLTLIGLPWARDLVLRLGFDAFLPFPGYPGLPETPFHAAAFPGFLQEIQKEPFDLLLQMHGNGVVTNPLVALFGARQLGGFYSPGHFCPDESSFLAYPSHLPEIWRHLALLRHLGISASDDRMRFSVTNADREALDRLLDHHGIIGPYVCIHPGARAAWRCWPPRNYATVGDGLAQAGLQVMVTGSASEKELAQSVVAQMDHPAVNLAGETSDIGLLAALIERARLMICGDTGLSHLAVAVDCPSVVVLMRSEREGWTPLDRVRHRVVSRMGGVSPGDVLEEACSQLELSPSLPIYESPDLARPR